MGIWFASRPKGFGRDLKKAQDHFLKAIEYGQGKFLMTYVYYADYYARKAMDKDLFNSTLQKVLETPADISPDLTLLNTLAKKKAEALKAQLRKRILNRRNHESRSLLQNSGIESAHFFPSARPRSLEGRKTSSLRWPPWPPTEAPGLRPSTP